MPNLTFVLPHWLYWSGLILFPLLAAYFAHRQSQSTARSDRASVAQAYLLLVTGGFIGLHRFYLRVYWIAFGYIVLFLLILYGNNRGSSVRVAVSDANNDLLGREFDLERARSALADGAEGAAERVAQSQQAIVEVKARLAEVTALHDNWVLFSGSVGALILLLLIVDAVLLPRMTRRCVAAEVASGKPPREVTNPRRAEAVVDPTAHIHSRFTEPIDRLSGLTGHFVCYWSVIAVFVYYYEVVARYVFNSPTNWAHEGMFLMFGMQYLLAGAFALREDSHVRVDVLYLYLPDRVKALVDVMTSFFFFLFSGGLFVTGIIFAADAIQVWEVSFTEWAIQYWPVKMTIAIGGLLIVLQGLAKLLKDILLLKAKEA